MPLWKQLLGAATGATVALALYGTFVVASPHVQALLLSNFEGKTTLPTFFTKRGVYETTVPRNKEREMRILGTSVQSSSSALAVLPAPVSPSSAATSVDPPSSRKMEHAQTSSRKGGTKSVPSSKKEDKKNTQKLPDSGLPVWGGAGAALLASAYIRRRRKHASKNADNGSVEEA